ncbi:protein SRG1-like [Dioscorea cayenensis subsp. rotundata]|uniref:Protein SRG1-like n=1 Tax=Dioscorea cayennensis subsp. rotundata TaxID=55577 RepID=A0AB40CPW3_DIOCR|nr:protein SRG1-like [Dioscorea cayenensis subsp. rotundata]XP_039142054.1 protein SRG1-like [Dioscorea cayenensis subsp. rotundata]XP_039142055.1 protein SRG1-like [Dioscorea cayenensis subsp. rotundata]XP_039142056.1 protein SRG1-like [Dioscorea cayenensis subsp. rotundata]XP_039142057.1 protein SRG1-like [Dioscorea cayenensis subsp. rotundata]XP_039142058.1 protein SRG1-like [Dioscorea cayenensis subsp. rotundata]
MAEAEIDNLNLKNIGGSLPVPNVQSLAASKEFTEVPGRYVRPEINSSPVLDSAARHGDIPIIDLSRLDYLQHSQDEVLKLGLACEEWGFFQLINHGVPDKVIETMKVVIEEFFRLPLEEKKVYEQLPGSVEGYGHASVVSEEQKLDWGDMYFLSTRPVSGRNLKLWPTNPPIFKDALDQYSEEMQRVANILLEAIGKSLKLNKLIDNFKGGLQAIRINYYPPCPQASKVMGLSPHSDAVGLSVLLQVNDVQGLQIKKNGAWLPIKPLPNAFIINLGDIIEIMSNGKYKSIEHRAVVSPERERLSIVTFHSLRTDAQVGPLQAETQEKSEPFYYKDH